MKSSVMDHSVDCRALSPSVAVSGAATPQERSPLNNPCQVESGGTVLLQLLEFKTHLLEAVEELHIRRDAESRFEDQISKVVLEKQELEWEKESLQHQIETMENQHAQSLIDTKKQLQATIRHTEEEKGRYKVMAELKEKEISNLKEELKSLQLLKYNLEKKSNELEQKLALQIRSKDSHLNQLGEVEKRFKALSRQCASVKKAHEKLEQNVDEAMRINKKLAASNEKHEGTIDTLKKELDLANTQLIKAKMSSVRHDQTYKSQTHTEQHLQQLCQTLSMETEMNKRLRDEYAAVRSEKQEVMKSTHYTQQLLLSQTKTVSRLELQLQTQDEQYKALKQEHEVMREKCKAMEDKVIELMNVQQDFQALKEAHDDLQHKHTELSSQVKVQVQKNIHEMFPTLAEEIRGKPTDEPQSSAMLHVFGSQQNSAVSQNKILDCLEDTTAKNKLDGDTGGYEAPNPHVKSQAQLQAQCELSFSVQTKMSLGTSEKTGSDDKLLHLHTRNYHISESFSNEVSDLTFHQSGYELATSEIISESSANIINELNADCMSSIHILTENKKIDDSASFVGAHYHCTDTANEDSNIREEVEINTNQQRNTEDVLEKGYAGQLSEMLNSQTVERVNSQDDGEKSKQEYKTETTSACMVIGEEKEKTETDIEAQTTHDKKSNTPPDIDFMEKIVNVCDKNSYQKDMKKVAYYSPVNTNKGHLIQDVQSPTDQSLTNGSIIVVRKVQSLYQRQVQTNVAYIESTPTAAYRVVEKTPEDKRIDESSPKVSEPLSQSSVSLTIPSLTEHSNSGSNVTHTNDMGGTDTHEKLDDTQMVSHSQITIEEANRLMEKTCETGLHLETVSYDGDLNISNQYNTADSKISKCVLSESIQLKGGNDNSFGVSATKCHKPTVKETHGDVKESSPPKTHMYCVGSIKQTVLPTGVTGSVLHPKVQNFPVPEQNTSGSGGVLTESPYTTFPKNQHTKVPLVITRATDLLNASGVSGYTTFARRFQQGAQSVFRESRQTNTSAADDNKVSLTTPTCQVSSFSNTLHRQLPSVSLSRPPVPSHGSRSELEFEPLCSQEENQSSLRAQISKIEQFLETERLHLPKRRRTEN
ncbi:coiled-coil domain-containing protein 73-like [Nerophis ophidion]|uniref:coiled-coil domain-containing protein 73-like n=1 Tax=Nerophis ophidion TaxID=159077 RepID=UPI002AE09793|nr:coiled-coil domain-containing protein 73-like [Nerophis ophidion]